MLHLSFQALANPRRGNAWLVACVLLAASVIAVEFINPNLLPHPKATPAYRSYGDGGRQVLAHQAPAGTRVYAAEVVRIIDGDNFVARMRTGPGGDVETRVRLRSIDAAELHARCARSCGWRSPRVRRCNGCSPRAASCSLMSGRTNIQDASTPTSRREITSTCRQRCSTAAGLALTTTGGAALGADDRDRETGIRDQDFLFPDS
jgi:hypothetical protein